jgi:hypothetical protein
MLTCAGMPPRTAACDYSDEPGVPPLMKIKPALIVALGLAVTLTACDRLDDIRITMDYWRFQRRERAFEADMDRMAKDAHGVYQIEYLLTDEWLPSFLDDRPHYLPLPDGRFDMVPWLRKNAVEPSAVASGVFDPANRKVTIVDTGPNVVYVEAMMRPMRPVRYRAVKMRVPKNSSL